MEEFTITTEKSRLKQLYYRFWGWQYLLRKRIWLKIKLYFYDFEIAQRKSLYR